MFHKKLKNGVEIDSRAMDKADKPLFKRDNPSNRSVERAGHEMKENPPKQLEKTAKKFGKKRAKKQKIAMMLSKARKGE